MVLNRYVGEYVCLKVRVPADKRGTWLEAGTNNLLVIAVHDQHMDLVFPGGRRAASQVHYKKLFLS